MPNIAYFCAMVLRTHCTGHCSGLYGKYGIPVRGGGGCTGGAYDNAGLHSTCSPMVVVATHTPCQGRAGGRGRRRTLRYGRSRPKSPGPHCVPRPMRPMLTAHVENARTARALPSKGWWASVQTMAVTGGWKAVWGAKVWQTQIGWSAVGGGQKRLGRNKYRHCRRLSVPCALRPLQY